MAYHSCDTQKIMDFAFDRYWWLTWIRSIIYNSRPTLSVR